MSATTTTTTHHSPNTPPAALTSLAARSNEQIVTDLQASIVRLADCPDEDTRACIMASGWVWAELADRMGADFADAVETEAWAELGR